jgi:hypothetical protein
MKIELAEAVSNVRMLCQRKDNVILRYIYLWGGINSRSKTISVFLQTWQRERNNKTLLTFVLDVIYWFFFEKKAVLCCYF